VNIRATIRRRRGGDRVIKVSESGGTRSRRRPARLLKDSGRTQPELRIPGAAAQTRVVCVAGIRLGSGESARAFKGIICDDISEFESYMPSHAVVSPGMRGVMSAPFGLARHLWADVARASIADAHSPPTLETMFATCDVRHRAPPSL